MNSSERNEFSDIGVKGYMAMVHWCMKESGHIMVDQKNVYESCNPHR